VGGVNLVNLRGVQLSSDEQMERHARSAGSTASLAIDSAGGFRPPGREVSLTRARPNRSVRLESLTLVCFFRAEVI
jgi:hypothetical protein